MKAASHELVAPGFAGRLPSGEFIAVVVTVRVGGDATGALVEVPALLTEGGLISPLLKYCYMHRESRSLDWQRKLCRACYLFLQFASANRSMPERELLATFALRLHTGTYSADTGIDPSWLCWRPVSRESARRTLSLLARFFGVFKAPYALLGYELNAYDKAMQSASYAYARERAFLGHTWPIKPSEGAANHSLANLLPKSLHVQDGEPPAFPEERFMDLLLKGWCIDGRHSLRDMLITLMANGGGVRTSEPFHLYVTDVCEDRLNPGSALVLFHHPLEGLAPEDWIDGLGKVVRGTRRAYLVERWGLEPRTLVNKSRHAGWKGAALTREHGSKYFRINWFVPQLGSIFLSIWNRYLVELASIPRAHPFAFVNLARGERGAMYTMSAFRQAHANAVRRIGLTPSRTEGTTPHGHRHAYGRRLAQAGVPGSEIQRYMHHCSFESHLVYTRPLQIEVLAALDTAAKRLSGSTTSRYWDSCVQEVEYRMRRS